MSEPKTFQLEDLIPEQAEFSIKSTGKTYKLRPINLDDQVWIQKKFGEGLENVFKTGDLNKITAFTYHLLDQKGREDFVATKENVIDDDGNKAQVTVTGPEKLRQAMSLTHDLKGLVQALLKTMGISSPMLDNIQVSAEKKSN